MKKKNKLSLKTVLFVVVVAVITFALTMGNYALALWATVVAILALLYWQWPNILSLKGQSEYAKGNNTKALAILKKAHESSRSRVSNSTAYAYILLRVGQADEASKVLNYVLLNQKWYQD